MTPLAAPATRVTVIAALTVPVAGSVTVKIGLLNWMLPPRSSSMMFSVALERTPSWAGGVPPPTFDRIRFTVSVASASVSFTIGTDTFTLRTPGANVSVALTAA